MSDEHVSAVIDKVSVDAERRSMTTFQRAVVSDRAQQMSRRLERRKLQRNRTAFTPSQIEQLEQGLRQSSPTRILTEFQRDNW